jgi:hypothetical protein
MALSLDAEDFIDMAEAEPARHICSLSPWGEGIESAEFS